MATTSMMSLASVLRHTRAPILLQIPLVVLELLLGTTALLWVVGFTQLLAVVVDVGEILAELLTLAAVTLGCVFVAASAVVAAAAMMFAALLWRR
jgi:hypothetical protein